MLNLAQELDPINWDDYYLQTRQINRLKNAIALNKIPPAIFVSGPSGCGKTSAIKLFIKSIQCQRREHGNYQPCGECPTCKLDPRTAGLVNNVLWIQKGKEDSLAAQFNRAIEEANLPPSGMDEDHRWYKFIVVEELQAIPRDRLTDLLYYSELEEINRLNRVVFIFNTMDEGRIDPSTFKALRDRCGKFYLRFKPFSKEQTIDFLVSRFKDLPKESAALIAEVSDGSIRAALERYDECKNDDPSLSALTVAECLEFATASTRLALWRLMENCTLQRAANFKRLREFWKTIETLVNPQYLINQLDEDVEKSLLTTPNEHQLLAQRLFFSYRASQGKIRPYDLIRALCGVKIINYDLLQEDIEREGSYNKLFDIEIEDG